MDFPYGHHHHHHHRRNDDREGDFPPPPPPGAGERFPPPPNFGHYGQPPPNFEPYGHPPPNFGTYDQSSPPPPRPPYSVYESPPPPPPHSSHVAGANHSSYSEQDRPNYPPSGYAQHASHVSYEAPPPAENYGTLGTEHHHHRPNMPAFIESHIHEHSHQSPESDYLANRSTVRIYTKAEPSFSLAIRDGQVILARSESGDPTQHWIKDEKYSVRVKDEQGFPSFSLINKATGQAVKHSIGATQPVRLTAYETDKLDQSVLWTLSNDLGDGYKTIRMVNNIKLNVDAYIGENHGGVHDGTPIVLWEWNKGENQRWKIVPYCKWLNSFEFFSSVCRAIPKSAGIDGQMAKDILVSLAASLN